MRDSHDFQDAFCSTPDAVTAMVAMYEGCTSRAVLLALTQAVCSVVRQNAAAQKMFVAAGVADYISAVLTLKVRVQSETEQWGCKMRDQRICRGPRNCFQR